MQSIMWTCMQDLPRERGQASQQQQTVTRIYRGLLQERDGRLRRPAAWQQRQRRLMKLLPLQQ